ncbi:mitogen-activated protein kinase 19-like isoform X1 [Salvia splendens]|uniref:mitogen-activated protein kinase 19-like isoform X1 n=1 Tax=Salvia splendens TaxID=180675 RepID=UPI001C270B9A|nr:mitogen-activated protein kinase 19-like isoform X1 [Salvia splendens]
MQRQDQRKKIPKDTDFFTEYGEANRYKILEIIGKGSYGVVCAAIDTQTKEKVAIKKIKDIFEHTSDALRILREIKLLRLLRHPDIVEIKRIMIPPSRRDFKDIYVVFELMESDLHQVIKANDDLTQEHHRFFLYQMLRALKYMHTANVYHRDLKPKNILANANCKLKICDFGLARVAFSDAPTAVFWTDYVATRWYRAPELCGSFSAKYTPAIDIWSIGCIFAEVLAGKPLFPGKSVVHQLDLITDLLGTPSVDTISGVRNEKARKYLMDMRKKRSVPFTEKFPNAADPSALKLLQRLLAFDPKDRPSAEEALADPYFKGLSKIEREPSCQPISKMEFEFERRRLTKEDIRELIFREILEYHPQLLKDYMARNGGTSFLYPSAVGQFKKQFDYLEENSGKSGPVIFPERKHVSLPRSTVNSSTIPPKTHSNVSVFDNQKVKSEASIGFRGPNAASDSAPRVSRPPPRISNAKPGRVVGPVLPYENARHVNDSYGGGMCVQNATLPRQSNSPHCFFKTSTVQNQESCKEEEASQVKQQSQRQNTPVISRNGSNVEIVSKGQPLQYTPAKVNPATNAERNSNPYHQPQSREGTLDSQHSLDAKLMQAQSRFVAAGAAAVAVATHMEVGAIKFGLI